MSEPVSPRRSGRLAIYACYFATGAFGLTYEIVWSRYLALLVGNTAYAHAAVLATFMGGLALGAALFGPIADRIRDGLAAYGWVEVAIGLFGAFFPTWFGVCEALADVLYAQLTPGSVGLGAAKLLLAVLCVLPPAILMGGTLPLLTRALTSSVDGVRRSVAGLYATNAAGAVAGALLTGFWAMGALSLPGTLAAVGSLNTLLGLAVVFVARRRAEAQSSPSEAPVATDAGVDAESYDPSVRRMALWVAAFSGMATMALEVAWIRCGVLLLGSSTYAFTLMLAAFISGIAAGAYLVASPLAARWQLRTALGASLLATALALTVFLALYPRLPYYAGVLLRAYAPDPEVFPFYQVAVYRLCFVAMCIPAAVAGVVLPVAVRLATEQGRIGARLGQVYAANTVGTLLGSILTGLVLFRLIGVEGVFRAALVAYALVAAYVAWRSERRRMAVAAVLLAAIHPLATDPADPRLFNEGAYRRHRPLTGGFANFEKTVALSRLLYYADGPHASVSVSHLGSDLVLRVNGKPDASTGADMTTQSLIGHMPVLLHEAPRDVFLVGLGSGVTAGAVLAHPDLKLTVAEISEEVVAGHRFFGAVNGLPLKDPRSTLVVDDARTVLRASPAKYDVVISEPTNPWQAGVAGLFTVEFYDLVKTRLKPGGVFAQWMHAYETNDALVSLVLTTLRSRFEHVAVFELGPSDFAFIARDQPLHFEPASFAKRVSTVAESLGRVDAARPFVLLATQVMSAESVSARVGAEPLNTDAHPVLELRAPVAFFANQSSLVLFRADDRLHVRGALFVDQWIREHGLQPADVEGMARFGRRLISDVMRRSVWQLARAHLGLEHETTQRLTRHTDALDLYGWQAGHAAATNDAERAAWIRLGIAHYERHFVRWAPVPVEPLERAIRALDQVHARPLRGALIEAACRREKQEVCARLRRG